MSALRVVGVDPGPIPGIVRLQFDEDGALADTGVAQCSASVLLEISSSFGLAEMHPILAIERFVPRGRLTKDQRITNTQVSIVAQVWADRTRLIQRTASQVKPWATDERLDAAGLLDACKGMRHARDAARHALYAAVKDGGIPDPLSKDWRRHT